MKVIKSLENSLILLKGTTRKITIQEGGFLKFFRPLMTAVLSLIKIYLSLLDLDQDYYLDYQHECQQLMQLFTRKWMDQELQH